MNKTLHGKLPIHIRFYADVCILHHT
jgi:hypothetical protein